MLGACLIVGNVSVWCLASPLHYVLSPRVKRFKSILAKLDPASAERAVMPFSPPKPAGTPSLLLAKKRGKRR